MKHETYLLRWWDLSAVRFQRRSPYLENNRKINTVKHWYKNSWSDRISSQMLRAIERIVYIDCTLYQGFTVSNINWIESHCQNTFMTNKFIFIYCVVFFIHFWELMWPLDDKSYSCNTRVLISSKRIKCHQNISSEILSKSINLDTRTYLCESGSIFVKSLEKGKWRKILVDKDEDCSDKFEMTFSTKRKIIYAVR